MYVYLGQQTELRKLLGDERGMRKGEGGEGGEGKERGRREGKREGREGKVNEREAITLNALIQIAYDLYTH